MTENDVPPDHPESTTPAEDELVSAVVDGEATEAERAAVEADPRLAARRRVFDSTRVALTVEPIDPAARDRAIRAAVEDATSAEPRTGAEPESDTVVALAWERRRRRIATIVAIAAAVLIVVPLVAITLIGGGRDVDFAATSNDDASSGSGASSDSVEPLGEANAGAPLPPEIAVGDLGELDSTTELRAIVQEALDTTLARRFAPSDGPASTTSTVPSVNRSGDANEALDFGGQPGDCVAAVVGTDPTLGLAPVLAATATWLDDAVYVFVFRTLTPAGPGAPSDVPIEVIVVTRPDCSVVERVQT
jgi:hypothetical protein